MRHVLILSTQGQLDIFLLCYFSNRLLKESQDLEESKNLLSQKIRYCLVVVSLMEVKSLKVCWGRSAGNGGKSEDAGERREGEEDHDQHWQEQVSPVESYFQVWHEDQVRQEGIALQLNLCSSYLTILCQKVKISFIRNVLLIFFSIRHGGGQQATKDAGNRWHLLLIMN